MAEDKFRKVLAVHLPPSVAKDFTVTLLRGPF